MLFIRLLFLLSLSLPALVFASELEIIDLELESKDRFKLITVYTEKCSPVVIYNHGKILEVTGIIEGASKGYDLREFAKAISDYGYNALIPVRSASLSASTEDYFNAVNKYLAEKNLENQPVSLIGFSKGGSVAFEAAGIYGERLSSLVLMSPAISEQLIKQHKLNADLPVLLTLGTADPSNIISLTRNKLLPSFKSSQVQLIDSYPGDHSSFWKVRKDHWPDVMEFIKKAFQ